MRRYLSLALLGAVLALATGSHAQDIASFEKRITVKVLKNGLTVVICRRPEAPVFSFYTLVDAGSVQDPQGESGMAHMFEHMAFKGTDRIGTTDYAKEKLALDRVEKAYAAYDHEDRRQSGRDPAKVARLKAEFDKAEADANQYVIPNRFGELIEREGGTGLNANTCPSIALKSGPIWNPGDFCTRCCASSTRNAMWCMRNGACAPTAIRSERWLNSICRRLMWRIRTSARAWAGLRSWTI